MTVLPSLDISCASCVRVLCQELRLERSIQNTALSLTHWLKKSSKVNMQIKFFE